VILQLISSPVSWSAREELMENLVLNVFHLTEIYNWSLQSLRCQLDHGDGWTGHDHGDGNNGPSNLVAFSEKIRILIQIRNTSTNDSSVLQRFLKPLPAASILHSLAQKRASLVSLFCTKSIWENLHESDPTSSAKLKLCFQEDGSRLELVTKTFLQVPTLLSLSSIVKNGDNGLSKNVTVRNGSANENLKLKIKNKLCSVYYESMWSFLRDMVDDLLLWGLDSCVPLAFLPLETVMIVRRCVITLFIGLGMSLKLTMIVPFQQFEHRTQIQFFKISPSELMSAVIDEYNQIFGHTALCS